MDREVKIPALGEHMIYPTLIAAAVGEHFGLTADEIEKGISRFVPTRMRMNLVQRGENITILDDTYNANPQSMRRPSGCSPTATAAIRPPCWGICSSWDPIPPPSTPRWGSAWASRTSTAWWRWGTRPSTSPRGQGHRCGAVYYCRTKEEAKAVLPEIVKPDSTILVKASGA